MSGEPVDREPARRTSGSGSGVAVVVVTAVGLVLALAWIGFLGVHMATGGPLPRRGLGIGLVLLAVVGAWATAALVRDGLALQEISRAAAAEGCELDVSEVPRMPSGRLEREPADRLFAEVGREYERDPENWRAAYRLARAYDHAGDRSRARETMRTARDLRARELAAGERG